MILSLLMFGGLEAFKAFLPAILSKVALPKITGDLLLAVLYLSFFFWGVSWLVVNFVEKKLKKVGPVLHENMGERENLLNYLDFEAAQIFKATLSKNALPFKLMLLSMLLKGNRLLFIFNRLYIKKSGFEQDLLTYVKTQPQARSREEASILQEDNARAIEAVLWRAQQIAVENGFAKINIYALLLSLLEEEPFFRKELDSLEIVRNDVIEAVLWMYNLGVDHERKSRYWERENMCLYFQTSPVQELVGGYTLTLNQYSRDLSVRNPLFWSRVMLHEKQVKDIEETLIKQNSNCLLLVGEVGSGRKSVLYNFAKKILKNMSFRELSYMRILEIDMPSLIGSAGDKRVLEVRLKKVFNEAIKAENVILVIPQMHNYVGESFGAEAVAKIDITGILSQYLTTPGFRLIGITSYDGYHKSIETNRDVASNFAKIEVPSPSLDETLHILEEEVVWREARTGVFAPLLSLQEIIKLCDYFIGDISFPKKAVDLLDEVMVYERTRSTIAKGVILPEEIDLFFSTKYEVPAGTAAQKEKETLLNMENLIHQGLINQKEAVSELANAMRRARADLKKRKRTIGNFLFLGPSGVGKTETAKQLAKVYFGSDKNMIRLNMAEYQLLESIDKLIGSLTQPGYLTTAIRENPFCLLLIDEIEKAHPNLLNLFLSILDDGELIDGSGRKVDFRHSIIIATSNAGADYIREAVERGSKLTNFKDVFIDNLLRKNIFRPEFVNRFDATVLYRPLNKEEMQQVAELMLKDIRNGLREKNMELAITPELLSKLADEGFDPAFGGRAMRRAVQNNVENIIATAVLAGTVRPGDVIEIDPVDWKLIPPGERDAYHEKQKGTYLGDQKDQDAESERLMHLEDIIHQGLINQKEAVSELCNALRRAQADIKTSKRTIGNFLFLGPTGIGKTETAKQLAKVYFGSEKNMIRLNMAEYQLIDSIDKLIGNLNSPGYFTTQVMENPQSLILIDEIEKAHPNILNLFLSIFDDGEMADGSGRKVDFKKTIMIATSNAGAEYIKEAVDRGSKLNAAFKDTFIDNLLRRELFKPEFLNRFDAVVLYRPLDKEEMKQVAQLMVADIKKGLAVKDIEFRISPKLIEKLGDLGFDPAFGGRAMRRAVQNNVENLVANALLSKEIKRYDIIEIDPFLWKVLVVGSNDPVKIQRLKIEQDKQAREQPKEQPKPPQNPYNEPI
jgi:ATP-dependent Clp protease ATP-binding subunit ClpC